MKKLFLFLFIAASAKTQATVITVSNTPNSPAQFTDLQLAINVANNGDTIYVSGSLVNYGVITIDKPLVLLGAGFNPQKEMPLVSQLTRVDILNTAEGSVIEGFIIINTTGVLTLNCTSWQQYFAVYSSTCVNNICIRRCKIEGGNANVSLTVGGSDWLIENNIIHGIDVNNQSSSLIKNNLITYYVCNSNQPTVTISNNLFINAANIGFYDIYNTNTSITNAVISNNIFYGAAPVNCINSIFNKNLTFNTAQNTLPYGTNIGAGNIENQDPQFSTIQSLDYIFDFLDDYRLLPTSPGHNAGTDGTDIGPFGGFNPFPSSPIGGEPKIPQVKNMNINNTSLPLNGNLNINVKGKKQD
jgi:hypothetical protein